MADILSRSRIRGATTKTMLTSSNLTAILPHLVVVIANAYGLDAHPLDCCHFLSFYFFPLLRDPHRVIFTVQKTCSEFILRKKMDVKSAIKEILRTLY